MSMCRLMDAVMANRWRRRRPARNNKHIRITITIQCFSEAEFSEALKKPVKISGATALEKSPPLKSTPGNTPSQHTDQV